MRLYHKGDLLVDVNANQYHLRLTVGALCEIAERLSAAGPVQLSKIMRDPNEEQIGIIVEACLRPVHGFVALSPHQARQIFTQMPGLFEQAFAVERAS